MPVTWIPGSSYFGNAFLAGNVLVDAGVSPASVSPYKEEIDVIVLTHCHFDHIAYLREIRHLCDATVCIHAFDAPGLIDDNRSLSLHFGARSPGLVPERLLSEGDRIGDLQVIHTPGHTPGSICLLHGPEKALISGDTVFTDGGFGRYDFPGGDRSALLKSIERLSTLDIVGLFPGHGAPAEQGGSGHIAAARDLLRTGYG
ncbi:MAG: MBL fold metallo-hydrolase [Methanoregulaceae archaeon]|nr:MBL fold metallo-hydrolase [Methanoregulaceae archaeon]